MAVDEGATKSQETGSDTASGKETTPPDGKGKPTDSEAKLMKEMMAYKRKAEALEKAQEDAEKKRLADQGEFKTLAEKADAKAKAAQERLKLATVKGLAAQSGIIDPDLIAIADLSGVTVDDDGSVSGATEAIEAFKAAKPAFFGTPTAPGPKPTTTPKPSGGSAGTGGPATFKEWEAMPVQDRYEWAKKNTEAYQALCTAHKAAMGRR